MLSITLVLLAFAVSIDGFGAGMAYGLRNIRIPLKSVSVIALCSGIAMLLSMHISAVFVALLPIKVANGIGSTILIGIGVWALFSGQASKNGEPLMHDNRGNDLDTGNEQGASQEVLSFEIKQLGLVIRILKKPTIADMDRSGTITVGEATLLGCALSLDAFGAGLGAAMIGLPVWSTAVLIALMSALFLLSGLQVGLRFRRAMWLRRLHYVPGALLIMMGLSRLWW